MTRLVLLCRVTGGSTRWGDALRTLRLPPMAARWLLWGRA